MATPSYMIEKLQRLDINRMVSAIFASTAIDKEATDLLREQWEKGQNKEGGAIGYYASSSYAQRKHQMNPMAGLGVVDLMLTHALERGLYLEVQGDTYQFKSSDEKYSELHDKYPMAWGLGDVAQKDLRQIISDELVKEILSAL